MITGPCSPSPCRLPPTGAYYRSTMQACIGVRGGRWYMHAAAPYTWRLASLALAAPPTLDVCSTVTDGLSVRLGSGQTTRAQSIQTASESSMGLAHVKLTAPTGPPAITAW